MKTSAAGSLYSNENSIASRIHATKVDPKTPNFKVFSCHSVVSKYNYVNVYSLYNWTIVKSHLSCLIC